MVSKSRNTEEIRKFILNNVKKHPKDIGRITAEKFKVSRSAVSKHLKKFIEEEVLEAEGSTKARHYKLHNFVEEVFRLEVSPRLFEHTVWRTKILPLLKDVKSNVIDICYYGFTEMLNNVVDHSNSQNAVVFINRNAANIEIEIRDTGVGIFKHIQSEFDLEDPRHALLELSKGKLTTDSANHTGEGIFFTSRMFDEFSILSSGLYFSRINKNDDWLIEVEDRDVINGTRITMDINPAAKQIEEDIFNQYKTDLDSHGFTRTHVPIILLKYEGEELISRSQAKRLLSRFNRFKEVFLDFKGIAKIGQAFADQVFRVFPNEHPDVKIVWVNTNKEIENMISRVINR